MAREKGLSKQVQDVLDSKFKIGHSKFEDKKLGISDKHIYSWSTYRTYLKQEDVIEIFKDKDNFYFKKSFRVNATRGFWEVEYWSKDIINYSDEILAGGNNVRVNDDGEKNSN